VNCFANNNIFNKLIAADKDFIGGLYALKQFDKPPLCSSIPLDKDINRSNIPFNSGIIEMLWLSSGCWMIKRSVIEKMAAAYPELTYVGDDNVAGKQIHGLCNPAIFDLTVETTGQKFRKYLSEDWSMPLDPDTKVLCDNFIWKPIKDINSGETVIAFDEYPTGERKTRKIIKTKVIDKVQKLLPKIKIVMEDGNEVITTAEHQWLVKMNAQAVWERTDKLQVGNDIYNPIDCSDNSTQAIKVKFDLKTQKNSTPLLTQRKTKIKEIVHLNEIGQMICLVTESHTFIANGLASHNCQRWKDIGGKLYADTSIVLKHLGKVPYTLWNVEVVQRNRPEINTPNSIAQQTEKPLDQKVFQQVPLMPENILEKINKINKINPLPAPGFDLQTIGRK
jgi:hypothetical protein